MKQIVWFLAFDITVFAQLPATIARNGSDVTAQIQAAIDQTVSSGGNTLTFPTGNFGITQLRLPANFLLQCAGKVDYGSPNTTVFTALAQTAMFVMKEANQRRVSIDGCTIDGANLATAGTVFDVVVDGGVTNSYFKRFPSVAIRGGSSIFLRIAGNSFSMDGRAWDFQNAYASISTYYGCNVCWFEHNIVSAGQGVRTSGVTYIRENDFELGLNAPATAVIDISDSFDSGGVVIEGNYFELTKGSASVLQAIRGLPSAYTVKGNQIYGDKSAGSIGINLRDGYVYSAEINGNALSRWAIGLQAGTPALAFTEISANDNSFNNVDTPIGHLLDYHSAVQGAAGQVLGPMFFVDPNYGFVFHQRAIVPSITISATSQAIDLGLGNTFELRHTVDTTINAVRHVIPGQQFFIESQGNAVVTLSNDTFHLAANRDFALPAHVALPFFVDGDGIVREVGYGSLALAAQGVSQ